MAIAQHPAKPKTENGICRCSSCGIFIFNNAAEAALHNIPYAVAQNHRFNDLCIGCAGGHKSLDHLLDLVLRAEHKEQVMKTEKNDLFIKVETGVVPPNGKSNRWGTSKYQPLENELLKLPIGKNGESEWARFLLTDKKTGRLAQQHLRKRGKDIFAPNGHSVLTKVVGNEDGTAWLYAQRVMVE